MPKPQWLAGILSLLIALAIYVATLDNGLRLDELKGGDLITHQYAQVEGRPSNAPGYPLYTMLGWIWFRLGKVLLPFFSPLEVLSFYSTIWSLAALVIFYLLALNITRGQWLIAAAGTTFYAVTYFFWYYSVSTEQYTSAVMQTLLLLLLAFRWEETRNDRYLAWMAFVVGTCLANLVTTLLVVPALVFFVVLQDRALLKRRRLLVRLAALALLPSLSYVYVYVRGAQHPEWRGQGEWPSTLAWFLDFVSTRQGRQEMTLSLLPLDFSYLQLVPAELTWPVLLAGLGGLASLGHRRVILTLGSLLLYLVFTYVDRYGNWFQVVMPAYPIVILGAMRLLALLAQRTGRPNVASTIAAMVIVMLAADRLTVNLPRANLRNRPDDDAFCPGLAVLSDLDSVQQDQKTVLLSYDEQLSVQYLCTVMGCAPTVDQFVPAVHAGEAHYVSRSALPLVTGSNTAVMHTVGEVLLSRKMPGIAQLVPSGTLGPLQVVVLGAESRQLPASCGLPRLVVRVLWSVVSPPNCDLIVSARPLSNGQYLLLGNSLVQQDHPPLWGAIPTSLWRTGQQWFDSYSVPLPPGRMPDSMELVAYVQEDGELQTLWETVVPLPAPVTREPPTCLQ